MASFYGQGNTVPRETHVDWSGFPTSNVSPLRLGHCPPVMIFKALTPLKAEYKQKGLHTEGRLWYNLTCPETRIKTWCAPRTETGSQLTRSRPLYEVGMHLGSHGGITHLVGLQTRSPRQGASIDSVRGKCSPRALPVGDVISLRLPSRPTRGPYCSTLRSPLYRGHDDLFLFFILSCNLHPNRL